MTNDELQLLMATKLTELAGEVDFLRKFIFMQISVSNAQQEYIARIAPNQEKAKRELFELIQRKYDAQISAIESFDPAYAARIDMRSELDESGQMKWYFPPKPSG